MKSSIVWSALVAAIFLVSSGYVQAQPKAQQVSAPQVSDQQWEYIVVSYGKTLFESPQKTLAYRTLGLSAANANEATDLQSALDLMGRFGWEVVTIVGAIGGDQQILLKRKYDKTRSANEYGMILRGKELYLNDLADIIERSNRLAEEAKRQAEAERNRPRLIDLDALDEQAAREKKLVALEGSYTEALQRTELAPNSTISVKYKYMFSNDINVDIRTDLTSQFLKNGNGYRRKEVAAYLKRQIQRYRFKDPLLEKYDGVKISVTGFIRFNGTEVNVGRYETSTSVLDRWSD